ncbi:hypothetical protein DFP72DRAFT_828398, partial [Ephemerocybe angulata]
RSVHNIRIERLWVDFTNSVGGKWRSFFDILGVHAGLNFDNPYYLWILHFLFLDAINEDITLWANIWNCHKMSLSNEQNKSLMEMKTLSLIQHSPRGYDHDVELNEQEIAEYGINWEDVHDNRIQNHHRNGNSLDIIADNPFISY